VFFWVLTRIVLPLGLLYGLLWWRADAAVERQLSYLRPYVDIQRGRTVLGINGDIGSRDLVVRPQAGGSLPAGRLTAERAVVHTPGLFWLIRSSLIGVPNEIPSRIGFSLENVEFSGSDGTMAATAVVFPFDLAGCEPAMTRAVSSAMGLDGLRSSFRFVMTREGNDGLRLGFDSGVPNLVNTSGEARLSLFRGTDPVMRLAGASLQSMEAVIADQGFVAARNGYCATKMGITPEEFASRHVEAVRAEFFADRLVPGAAVTQAYAGFSKDGGRLLMQARPLRPRSLAQMRGTTLRNLNVMLNATVQHDGSFAAPLVFVAADEYAGVADSASGTAAAPTAAPVDQAAAELDVAPIAAAASGARGSPGDALAYDDLPGYVGATVEVGTALGSVRTGVLTGASSLSIVVRLSPEDGGFAMTFPRHNVVAVRLASPPTDSPD